jgi:hypothetical protein
MVPVVVVGVEQAREVERLAYWVVKGLEIRGSGPGIRSAWEVVVDKWLRS